MKNDKSQLTVLNNNDLTPTSTGTFKQTGKQNVQVGHADEVKFQQVIQVSPFVQSQDFDFIRNKKLDHRYYNLIVSEQAISVEANVGDIITLEKESCLNEFISEDVADQFTPLDTHKIDKIKGFPTIYMSENFYNGSTFQNHIAYYGVIKDIVEVRGKIKLTFLRITTIPQQLLNNLAEELGLLANEYLNELNRTHWTIKKIDLIQTLKNNGIDIFTLQV